MTDVNSALIEHLRQRAAFGKNKYGMELRSFDGRNTLADAREEALDLAVYITKEIMEREAVADLLDVAADTIANLTLLIHLQTGRLMEKAMRNHNLCSDMAQKLRQDIKRIEPEDIVLGEDVTDQFVKRTWAEEEISELQGKWKND